MAKPNAKDVRACTLVPSRRWRAGVALACFFVFLIVDRITKHLVLLAASSKVFPIDLVSGMLSFRFVANRGAAFGMGEGMGWVFVVLAAAALIFTVWYLSHAKILSRFEVVGLGMVAAGALGNAFDRVVLGFVVDFISLDCINFPVFNVADIAIVCGAVLAFIGFMVSPANKAEGAPDSGACDDAGRDRCGSKDDCASKGGC